MVIFRLLWVAVLSPSLHNRMQRVLTWPVLGDADECITPDDVFDVLEEDMREADLLLWVGISFEQSASTHYFRKAREFLLRAGRWRHCTQAIVNLSEDAHFNLLSACNNIGKPLGRLLL